MCIYNEGNTVVIPWLPVSSNLQGETNRRFYFTNDVLNLGEVLFWS